MTNQLGRTSVRCLVAGRRDRDEFQSLVSQLLADSRIDELSFVPRLVFPMAAERGVASPSLIVVLESHPDETAEPGVQAGLQAYPLARFVCAYGAWSLSARRNRSVWPGSVRVDVRHAWPRIDRELAFLCGGGPLADILPLTATIDDIFAADHDVSRSPWLDGACVAVESPDCEFTRMLQDVLRTVGAVPVTDRETRPDFLLFDADPDGPARRERLRERRSTDPGVPVMLLTNSPWNIEPHEGSPAITMVADKLRPVEQWMADIRRIIDWRAAHVS